MRWFVRQSAFGGRVCAFNQYYRSKISDDVLKILSKDLNVTGNVYDKIEAYMKFKNDRLKKTKDEYDESKFNDFRDIDESEMNIHFEKLGELPIHELLQELSLNDLLWDFDAVSLYSSAVSHPNQFIRE